MPLAEATSLAAASLGSSDQQAQHSTGQPGPSTSQAIEHDPEADLVTLEQLASECEQFSPLVGLEDSQPPEGLLLDVTNLSHLFHGEPNLAKQVDTLLRRRGYLPRLAIADTIGAAWAVNRTGNVRRTGNDCRTGDIRTGHIHDESPHPQYSDSIVILSPGETQQQLDSLPVWSLRIPDPTVELLSRLGIRYIGQLLNLPRDGLNARFGGQLLHRMDQALGIAEETIVAASGSPTFEAHYSIEHPTARRETILQIVLQLMQQLSQQLFAAGQGALQIECCLQCCGDRTIRIHVGLFEPRADADHLIQLAALQLDTLVLPGAARKVSINVVSTARLAAKQQELWTDRHRDAPQQLAWLVERLSSRLGQQRVLTARLQPAIQPERACCYVALTGSNAARRIRRDQPRTARQLPERPLWMPSLPLPLAVTTESPDGPPVSFQYDGQRHHVLRHWGPERIETAWWRGQCVRRDYYRIETERGIRFWLFLRLHDRLWFLHGFLG